LIQGDHSGDRQNEAAELSEVDEGMVGEDGADFELDLFEEERGSWCQKKPVQALPRPMNDCGGRGRPRALL
jgi:hypothetical protein